MIKFGGVGQYFDRNKGIKTMITSNQLIYKLQLQSKRLTKSLNLPSKFGEELLARAIYNFSNFKDVCEHIELNTIEDNYQLIFSKENAKYLMINEIEDAFLIEELDEEVENMTTRLESMTMINISKNDLISILYELFGLEDESKYVVNPRYLQLEWQSNFQTLKDKNSVLFCDFEINKIPFRMLATKINFDDISVDNVKNSINENFHEDNSPSFKNYDEKNQIEEHRNWLLDSVDCISNIESTNVGKHPHLFKINNQNYLIYGFPLSPHLQVKCVDEYININIKLQIKNTEEKQVFTLNLEAEKLALECIFIDKIENGEYTFSPKNQWIKDSLLSRDDACQFPLVFNKSYYLMILRPFTHIDLLENAL
jgi:hypothetical protein